MRFGRSLALSHPDLFAFPGSFEQGTVRHDRGWNPGAGAPPAHSRRLAEHGPYPGHSVLHNKGPRPPGSNRPGPGGDRRTSRQGRNPRRLAHPVLGKPGRTRAPASRPQASRRAGTGPIWPPLLPLPRLRCSGSRRTPGLVAEQPRTLKCRRCGVVVPSEKFPAKANGKEVPEEAVEVLPGVIHHYPYHVVEEGKSSLSRRTAFSPGQDRLRGDEIPGQSRALRRGRSTCPAVRGADPDWRSWPA